MTDGSILKPNTEEGGEERRSKKGIESRKRSKAMRELARSIADGEVQGSELREKLLSAGLDEKDLSNSSSVVYKLFEKASQGDIRAIEKWQALLGEDLHDERGEAYAKEQFRLPASIIAKSFFDVNLDIDESGHREYIFKGGRGSTKSSYISLKIIELMLRNSQMHAVAMRYVAETMRDSVFAQIRWAIDALGLTEDFRFTTSPLQISRISTKQKIYFRGADDPAKLKSIRTRSGYIGILWLEELDGFRGPETVRMIEQSILRGGDRGFIFKSFNPPRTSSSWANRYVAETAALKESAYVHHSSYLDVPKEWLGQLFLDEAEHLRKVNPKAYAHEYGGEINETGGQVFSNVVLRPISNDEVKSFGHMIYQGVDWGWFPDPFAFVRLHYDARAQTVYILDEIYGTKISNEAAAGMIMERSYGDNPIRCDSSEPKSLQELHSLGLPVKKAVKGPGSVEYGMKWLQSRREIVICPKRTPNAAREFSGYEYLKDRDGSVISGYPDADNHIIDAVRYALEPVWMRPSGKQTGASR
ncbi:MAG: PBSX family phage terminase large subunit [Christensenellales bacterium]